MMLKIAVLDDEQIFHKSVEKKIYSFYEKIHLAVNVNCYSSGKELLYEVDDGQYYDIYLLDIDLPDMPGIHLGRRPIVILFSLRHIHSMQLKGIVSGLISIY